MGAPHNMSWFLHVAVIPLRSYLIRLYNIFFSPVATHGHIT